ncbi:MAG: hypothetical protein H7Y11_02475 [Armatimonadetes bacterium]|nr:hypothetical protein [Anaerolineae bacterium]
MWEGNATTSTTYLLGGDHLIAQTSGATTRYLLPDALGSTRALTDLNGGVTASYYYQPFGTRSNIAGVTATDTAATRYLYTAQQFDATTSLYHLRARAYHPGVGRFHSRDTWAI